MRDRIIYKKKKIINNYTFLPFFLRHVRDMHNVLLFWKKTRVYFAKVACIAGLYMYSTSIYAFYIKFRVYNKISLIKYYMSRADFASESFENNFEKMSDNLATKYYIDNDFVCFLYSCGYRFFTLYLTYSFLMTAKNR